MQGFDGVEKLAKGPGESVELPHNQGIIGPHIVEGGLELRPVALRAAGFLGIHPLAPRGLEGIELQGKVLVVRGHTSITDGHGHGGTPLGTG